VGIATDQPIDLDAEPASPAVAEQADGDETFDGPDEAPGEVGNGQVTDFDAADQFYWSQVTDYDAPDEFYY
jgi:hypothetical protein